MTSPNEVAGARRPARDLFESRAAGGWMALALLAALAAMPAVRAGRRSEGFDSRAYIGAAYNLERGRPIYTDTGFDLRLRDETGAIHEVYFPPFLYHPALAWVCRGALRACSHEWDRFTRGVNAGGFVLLSAGLVALLLACGLPPAAAGMALVGVWWSFLLPFAFIFGNGGPIMSGLVCLGGAALVRRRNALAGLLFGIACLFKPPVWLLWIALAALWRPERRRDKVRLLGGWFGAYAAATLALAAGPGLGQMTEYAAMLRRTLGRAWCMSYMDASLGATALRAVSRWGSENHGMMIFGYKTVQASVGLWGHEDLMLMKVANAAGLFSFAGMMFWRRDDLAPRPLAITALAVVAGFLFQPANWAHNYGCLFLAAPAILLMIPRGTAGAERGDHAETGRRIAGRLRAMGWEAALVTVLMLWPAAPLLMKIGFFTTEMPADADGAVMLRWHLARLLNSLPTLWLLALTGLMLRAAALRPGEPSREGSGARGPRIPVVEQGQEIRDVDFRRADRRDGPPVVEQE